MEIVLIFLAPCVWFLFKVIKSQSKNTSASDWSPPSEKNRIESSKRFQASKALPLPEKQVLVGRARVVDGDTIVIKKTQIRLFGIDAPELNHPYGQKAKWALVSLCKGNDICAEISEQDVHGRTVASCCLPDGRDLSAEMVKAGLAIDWPKYSGGMYRAYETSDARRKMWLADARQKGRMDVWERFEAKQHKRSE